MNTRLLLPLATVAALVVAGAALFVNVLAAPALLAGLIALPLAVFAHDYAPRRRGFVVGAARASHVEATARRAAWPLAA